jgi:hypothetical protein
MNSCAITLKNIRRSDGRAANGRIYPLYLSARGNLGRICILTLLLMPACGGASVLPARSLELRVLFIGNSLTYANDLPAIVEALADTINKGRLTHKMVAFPNYSLEDHWNQGDARRAIAEHKWDFVVLQQGPSALPESRALLVEYARRFAEEIRRSGARPALYMVWPAESRLNDFDRVRDSYEQAAKKVDGLLFPAGDAWRAAWRQRPGLALYSPDGLHPTLLGSYLAAVVICRELFEWPAISLPARLKLRSKTVSHIDLSPQDAELIRAAASEACANARRR